MKQNFHSPLPRRAFLQTAATLTAAIAAPVRSADSPRRRIGFVDSNLDNYHANVFLQALRGPLRELGLTVTGATALKTAESRAWAEKNDVPFFQSDAALNEVVDFYMVLAPSAPEVHLELCRRFLPFGKPAYVDKTFAPDFATAQKIFNLADQHGTPIQTSSALRYTNVQAEVAKASPASIDHMITWGGGGSFSEYAIHPLELLISVMGPHATALMRRGTPERSQLLINFQDDRTGVVNVFTKTNTPFAATITTGQATHFFEVDSSKIFVNNMAAILDFFATGRPNVDRRESLLLMRLLDLARDPRALKQFVSINQ